MLICICLKITYFPNLSFVAVILCKNISVFGISICIFVCTRALLEALYETLYFNDCFTTLWLVDRNRHCSVCSVFTARLLYILQQFSVAPVLIIQDSSFSSAGSLSKGQTPQPYYTPLFDTCNHILYQYVQLCCCVTFNSKLDGFLMTFLITKKTGSPYCTRDPLPAVNLRKFSLWL